MNVLKISLVSLFSILFLSFGCQPSSEDVQIISPEEFLLSKGFEQSVDATGNRIYKNIGLSWNEARTIVQEYTQLAGANFKSDVDGSSSRTRTEDCTYETAEVDGCTAQMSFCWTDNSELEVSIGYFYCPSEDEAGMG